MPRAHLASLVVSLTLLSFPLAAAQVEVHLRTGAVVTGEIVSDDSDKLVLKSTSVSKSGKTMTATIPYKHADIAEVVALADPEEVYRTKNAAAMTAEDHATLAQWCREQNLTEQAVEHGKKAVELDATQEAAIKLLSDLDWMRVDGKWLHESEALAAQGKVRFQGKIMTVAEADALKASAKQQAVAAGAERAADDKVNSLATIDRQLADLKKRPALIDTDLAKASADLAAAEGLAQKATAAKATLDAAQKSLDQARTSNQNTPAGGGANNSGTNLLPLTQAVENAQKALAAARRDAGSADAQVAQAKAKIAALNNEKKTVEKKIEDLTAKREVAAKAAEAAKAASKAETKPVP
ncbi:MAG TPA: hypothetical protein VHX44_10095 [Planctomycetota bacterium]|nr:hypothetical protein [Planctomycetota bacterium]